MYFQVEPQMESDSTVTLRIQGKNQVLCSSFHHSIFFMIKIIGKKQLYLEFIYSRYYTYVKRSHDE